MDLHANPPGYYIREILQTLQISYEDFGNKMDMTRDEVIELLLGNTVLDDDIATRLENVFHVEKKSWLELERQYRMTK